MNISIPLFSVADRFTLKGVGSSARLLSLPIPESYSDISHLLFSAADRFILNDPSCINAPKQTQS